MGTGRGNVFAGPHRIGVRGIHAQSRAAQHLFHLRRFQPARAHDNAGTCALLLPAIIRGHAHGDLCPQSRQYTGKGASFRRTAKQDDFQSFSFLS